jgi:hypothetical protein
VLQEAAGAGLIRGHGGSDVKGGPGLAPLPPWVSIMRHGLQHGNTVCVYVHKRSVMGTHQPSRGNGSRRSDLRKRASVQVRARRETGSSPPSDTSRHLRKRPSHTFQYTARTHTLRYMSIGSMYDASIAQLRQEHRVQTGPFGWGCSCGAGREWPLAPESRASAASSAHLRSALREIQRTLCRQPGTAR